MKQGRDLIQNLESDLFQISGGAQSRGDILTRRIRA